MNQKSKLWLTIGTISASALTIAPIAVVASCATTVSPSQAFAEALEGNNAVTFINGKGSYTKDQINAFAGDKKAEFIKELNINVPNVDKNQFELSIDSFTPDIDGTDASKHNVKFVIAVKNKNDANEPVAKTKEISLPVTITTSSAPGGQF